MPAPQGRTVLEQLEAWVAAQSEPKRSSALRLAGLSDFYSMIKTEGELTKKVRFSLQSPRIQKKLLAIGIDVGTTWVDMAKKAVDSTKDWFPDVTTRQDVVDLLRPYIERICGDKQLARMFFDGTELDSFCGKDPKSLPGFENIVAIIRFCVEDARSGGKRKAWGSDTLFYMEGQWAVFGRGCERIPELVGDEAFKQWICRQIPHERVDHIATRLNQALNKQTFSPTLLIDWRKGQRPSREKFEALLRAIQITFPEWLAAESGAEALPVLAPATEPPKKAAPPEPTSPSSVSSVLRKIMEGIAAELPNLEKEERALIERMTSATQAPAPTKHVADPGEVVHGMRFVLTAASFRREPVFNLDEVEDTARLIGELARRLALMNSMSPDDKRAVLHRLQHAFDELYVQVRHMEAGDEDLPAMFLDMKMTATALGGGNLDRIKS